MNKPKSLNSSGIPGMIGSLKSEWDTMILETFELKKHLENVRKQLSHALYQHDAACRVISRLIQERDEARQQLQLTQEQLTDFKQKIGSGFDFNLKFNNENVADNSQNLVKSENLINEQENGSISLALVDKMNETSEALYKLRKSRKKPSNYFKASNLESLTESGSYPLHSSSTPGVTCLDIHSENYICTGGNDGVVALFDYNSKKLVTKFENQNNSNKILGVNFTQNGVLLTRNDGVSEYWNYSIEHKHGELAQSIQGHHGIRASIHPLNPYFITATANNAWGMFNMETGQTIIDIPIEGEAHISSLAVHPDGIMMVTGLNNGTINIWDIRSQNIVATLEEHKAPVTNLKFSEKAIHLVSISQKEGTAYMWNMKKLKDSPPTKLPHAEGATIRNVDFDPYAAFTVTAFDNSLSFFKTSESESVVSTFAAHREAINDVKFSLDGSFLATVSEDRFLKTFTL